MQSLIQSRTTLSTRQLLLSVTVFAVISWSRLLWLSTELIDHEVISDEESLNLPHYQKDDRHNFPAGSTLNVSSILRTLDPNNAWEYPEIDVVYTWVNGSIPEWQKLKEEYRIRFIAELENKTVNQVQEEDKIDGHDNGPNRMNRYADHGELKYSMRSVLKHAPWVRKIYLITADGKGPDWLDASHPKIRLVSHEEIFDDPSNLPVFNSRPIELSLHNIPDVSDYFLYFNDDFFLGLPIDQSEFLPDWPNSGSQRVFLDFYNLPDCNDHCQFEMLGNGICDDACKTPACNWDFGDCGIKVREEGRKKVVEDKNYTRNNGVMLEANLYTDGVFNREVGISPIGKRKPVAHIPYFINKRLLNDVFQRFSKQRQNMMKHRFRHVEHFQMPFFYYHYFLSQKVYAPSMKQIWRAALTTTKNNEDFLFGNLLDPDNHYQKAKQDLIASTHSFKVLKDCAKELIEAEQPEQMSQEFIMKCNAAVESLYSDYQIRLPFDELSIVSKEELSKIYYLQKIVGRSKAKVKPLRRLEEPMKKPRKFICYEDEVYDGVNPVIDAKYLEVFTAMYPDSSPFEKF